jgi:hypothetical protein
MLARTDTGWRPRRAGRWCCRTLARALHTVVAIGTTSWPAALLFAIDIPESVSGSGADEEAP